MTAGKKVEIVKGPSGRRTAPFAPPASWLSRTASVLVGPLSGDEGIAVKDYAKTHPEVTFINGTSAAQDTTLRDPAPKFFRFSTDGAQWMAGLGTYAFNDKGYKKVATVAEDYSFPYTQVFGWPSSARPAERCPRNPGCRSATRIIPRSSPPSLTTSTRSTWRSAAPTASTS
jgi:branched-chain amino acid transport system substrate-binding protein